MHVKLVFSLDVNECIDGSHSCASNNAECNNNIGYYDCLCRSGYAKDGMICNGNYQNAMRIMLFQLMSKIHLVKYGPIICKS